MNGVNKFEDFGGAKIEEVANEDDYDHDFEDDAKKTTKKKNHLCKNLYE